MSNFFCEGMVVSLATSAGKKGEVVGVDEGGRMCKVKMIDSGEIMPVNFGDLRLTKPEKTDSVVVTSAELKGQKGTLIGVDDQDGKCLSVVCCPPVCLEQCV